MIVLRGPTDVTLIGGESLLFAFSGSDWPSTRRPSRTIIACVDLIRLGRPLQFVPATFFITLNVSKIHDIAHSQSIRRSTVARLFRNLHYGPDSGSVWLRTPNRDHQPCNKWVSSFHPLVVV